MLAKIEDTLHNYFNSLNGFYFSRIYLDYSITFLLVKENEHKILIIENDFVYFDTNSELLISVDGWENVEKLRGILSECISEIFIKGNILNIQIGERKLIIHSDDQYESWHISGKNGPEVVMLPGGELSTFLNSIE